MKKYKKEQWNLTWLKSEPVNLIWKILSSRGAQVYFVGGCVRDTVQGREIKDVDIATDSLPSEVIELAQSFGLKVIKTGYTHGCISVVIKKQCFEVTTFRSDLITDGRHSKVRFSSKILDDARRRDFTMNAIYMTIKGEIFDPISGWEDLVNNRIRFIGKPEKRIHEDYLRVLRYFRFLAIYGKHVSSAHSATIDACSNAIPGLKKLSHDRVWDEFQKILSADNPYLSFKLMHDCGVLKEILPFADIKKLKRFLEIEEIFKVKCNVINRLVALNKYYVLIWIEKFPLKKNERRWLNELLTCLKDSSSLRVKGHKYGFNLATAALAISKSDLGMQSVEDDLSEIKYGSLKKFPIKIEDFLQLIPPSKELGDELRKLKDIWFASNLELDRPSLLAMLEKTNKKNGNLKIN